LALLFEPDSRSGDLEKNRILKGAFRSIRCMQLHPG
jgi:hypothetical protein